MIVKQAIERGLKLYRGLVSADPVLENEFQASFERFFEHVQAEAAPADVIPSPKATTPDLAARRHLEWFLLERPSDHLGGVPAEALHAEWLAEAEAAERDLDGAFLQSFAGAFAVTSSDPGSGLWVSDLFGHGEYPIDEPEAALELQTSDLLVGRLFPIGDGVYRLSPAVACFRNKDLVSALRADLERMRAARRGVLRIEQVELERLFFSSAAVVRASDLATPPSAASARANAKEVLASAGLSDAVIEDVCATISAGTNGEHDVVADMLDELAFATDVDLERARVALLELWGSARDAAPDNNSGGDAAVAPDPVAEDGADPDDVRTAVEKFERGRAQGADVEQLISELANDLGVDAEIENGDPISLPDFPGVIGAMVEEFLWDVGRESGAPQAARMAGLRRLSQYGDKLGLLEDLGRRELLDFAGRWLLDEGELRGPEETRAVLDALCEFCRWCEANHSHELWTQCGEMLTALQVSVPRLVAARQSSAPRRDSDRPWSVLNIEGETLAVADDAGEERRIEIQIRLAQLLRPGDLVHARIENGELHASAFYPAELRELLERN